MMAAVLAAAVGLSLPSGMAERADEPLFRALTAIGAEAEVVTVDLWGRFDHMAGDRRQMAELADRIAMTDGRETDAYTEVCRGQHILRRTVGDKSLNLTAAVAENSVPTGASEVCLAVRISGEAARYGEVNARAEEITAIGENFGANIARNTCLRGYVNVKLKSTEKTRQLETILAQTDAQMITIQESDQYTVCTAYAPSIESAVQIGGDRVNLQIVLRDSGRGTEIYLGSPVLMMEY